MLALNSWSPGALRELVGVFGAAENLHSIFDREFEPLTFGDSAKHAQRRRSEYGESSFVRHTEVLAQTGCQFLDTEFAYVVG